MPRRNDESPADRKASTVERWLWRSFVVATLFGAVFWYGRFLGFHVSRAAVGLLVMRDACR